MFGQGESSSAGVASGWAGRVVVKVGSAVIAPEGRLDQGRVRTLAADLEHVRRSGAGLVVVSSGAVACGFRAMGLDRMPERIMDKQAAAAIGQHRLVRAWAEALAEADTDGHSAVAQVLLTEDDLEHRLRFLNARHTLEALLSRGVIPIVNENDSVSFEEIRVGDNDRLSALVAAPVGADLLVILSTAPGLCAGGPGGEVIPVVTDVAGAAVHVDGVRSGTGVGGMATKLEAAATATALGIRTVVAPGGVDRVVSRLLGGERLGTVFECAGAAPAGARKRWIGFSRRVRGTLVVDDGARAAITGRGASLLPGGIVRVEGRFGVGAAVELAGADGAVFARGLVSYGSAEIERIRGRRSAEIAGVLGYSYSEAVVHRDDMALTRTKGDEA